MKLNTSWLRLQLFFFITIISTLSSYAQDEWVEYRSSGDIPFLVESPALLVDKSKTVKTNLGELKTLTYAHQGKEEDPNYLYVINLTEYPEGTFPTDSLDLISEFLDASVKSCVDGVKGKLTYQADIDDRFNGAGKLFRIKHNEDYGIVKGKAFLKDDIFVVIQVFTTREKALNPEMSEFLDSFRLLF